ncbi:MAG: UbiA family prenyltransferase [Myxococcales bacterium]|nr:UbiA family prenyltransferase [Myxococcales bacterium]
MDRSASAFASTTSGTVALVGVEPLDLAALGEALRSSRRSAGAWTRRLSGAARALATSILRELALSHAMIRRDLSVTVVPALLFGVAARLAADGPLVADLTGLAGVALYSWLFVHMFCLDNQIEGVDEDRLNKPDRVIPSGRLSLADARRRRPIVSALFLAVGALLGVPLAAAAWVLLTALSHHAGWDRHWLTKNLGQVGLGSIAQLAAAWDIAAPTTPCPWSWVLALSGTLGVAMLIQDFRDVAGDAAAGRRTLPLVVGDRPARALCVLVLVALPLILHVALIAGGGVTPLGALFDGSVAALSLWIARRLWTRRSPEEDDRTYRLLPRLYCVELAFAVLFAL